MRFRRIPAAAMMTRTEPVSAGRSYQRPDRLEAALALLASGSWSVLAGGTDYYPMLGDRVPAAPILDITGIAVLRGIRRTEAGWRIGALTSWSEIMRAELPPAFEGLRLAAREVGSIQIQNRATIAGNLCNASPAADGGPPLLTLDAEVELRAEGGTRTVPLGAFIDGYRSTVLKPDELVTAVLIPAAAGRGASSFLKLGARKYLVISIAMVAVRLAFAASGRIAEARVAAGSCSAVAQRLKGLEAALVGHDPAAGFRHVVTGGHLAELSPIDDVRATGAYRREAARELILRALERAAS